MVRHVISVLTESLSATYREKLQDQPGLNAVKVTEDRPQIQRDGPVLTVQIHDFLLDGLSRSGDIVDPQGQRYATDQLLQDNDAATHHHQRVSTVARAGDGESTGIDLSWNWNAKIT